jgi:hypothetical protein
MKKYILTLLVMAVILTGCATKESLETYEPLQVSEFTPIEPYTVDTSKLEEETTIAISGILENQLLVNITEDGDVNVVTDESEANAVLLYSEQMAKIADMSDIISAYESVVKSQAELINIKNQTIKSLQDLVLLQQQSRDIYYQNFQLADRLYKQEHKLRMRENLIGEIKLITTSIGLIAVAML